MLKPRFWLTVGTAILVASMSAVAQEEKKPPKPAAPKASAPPTTLTPDLATPPKTAAPDAANEFKRQVQVERARLKELIKKHGKDSEEVKVHQQLIQQLEAYSKQTPEFPATGPPITPGFPGIPGGTSEQAMREYMQAMLKAGFAGGDTLGAKAGRPMAIQGLEFELKTLASEIRSSKSDEARKAKTEELREIAETVVVLRRRYRKQAIDRLEKQLAALRQQDEKDSADAVVARLLGGGDPPEKKADSGDPPEKKASKGRKKPEKKQEKAG